MFLRGSTVIPVLCVLSALTMYVFAPYPAAAQTTPLTTRVIGSGFTKPLFVTAPPGDTSRIFVVEQLGHNPNPSSPRIMIIDLTTNPPTTLSTPFLTVTGVSADGEEGLLGLAFSPDYASSGRFYLNYTDPNTQIARGTVSADPNIANATLTTIPSPTLPLTIEVDGSASVRTATSISRPAMGVARATGPTSAKT